MSSAGSGKVCPQKTRVPGIGFCEALDSPLSDCYHNVSCWFSSQALRTPSQLAIARGDSRLTYGELETRSNQLAHWLRASGVQSETVVAICTGHSLNFVVAALAVWKAGGAYLPLDPDLPSARMLALLNDAGVPILLTEKKFSKDEFEENRYVMFLDCESHALNAMPRALSDDCIRQADELAYVIYTSGSTGRPKGVEIAHRNLLNLIQWHQEAFRVTSSDRATQLASLSFDAAVWEIWPYLTAGASVHFVPEDVRTLPDKLRDWFVRNAITIGFVPTMLAESLVTLDWPQTAALRLMLTGADTLHRYPPSRLPFQLVNNYGPTECTVVTTSGIVPSATNAAEPPAIGSPIPNVQVHVLDEKLRRVAVGDPGELFIGGAGVARGYRNRPDLTAERFIPNTLAMGGHDRLYRTGDMVRVLPDGQLHFIGRTDEQVKIAGYRIEPNEITHALTKHAAIESSFVVGRQDASGGKKLVAYVVPKSHGTLTSAELRSFLQERLPVYMVPAEFVRIDHLPTLPNGKVDRAALPHPDSTNLLTDAIFVAPRNPVEECLADILAGLLVLDRVSVEDNFFMLGGHSLLGTQLIGRVRDAFGVELSLRTVFEASTVAQLSSEIESLLLAQFEELSDEEARKILETAQHERPPIKQGGLEA
ncbi:MAG TPA: non-ribosomal peptide synthetase [Candidatus Aquilonibacter sp.]|nr:non-ribosomal peptide synthetase [Candidatus Aquilonibacter sp.]